MTLLSGLFVCVTAGVSSKPDFGVDRRLGFDEDGVDVDASWTESKIQKLEIVYESGANFDAALKLVKLLPNILES